MSAPATATAAAPAKKGKLPLIIACVVSIAGGAVVPMFVNVPALMGKTKDGEADKPKAKGEGKTAVIPFDSAVVNLAEERMTRYLKVKISLSVDAAEEKAVTAKLVAKKADMKSWLLSHLAGKTLKDVSGTVGVNRLQREIAEKFEDILYPDGKGHLRNVLFEEYVVQ